MTAHVHFEMRGYEAELTELMLLIMNGDLGVCGEPSAVFS